MINKLKEKFKFFDYWLFIPYLIMCVIGIVMVYSASSINLTYVGLKTNAYMTKQVFFVLLGIGLVLLFTHLKPELWVKDRTIRIGVLILIAALLVAKFLSAAVNGANGWIKLGPISIQPAEFAKLYLVIYMAKIYGKREADKYLGIQKEYSTIKPMLLIAVILGLIIYEPDTGGFAICLSIVAIIFLANWKNYRAGLAIVVFSVASIAVGVQILRFWNPFAGTGIEYIYKRFEGFFNPFPHAMTSGKQLVNSYYAISNGGMFGVGLGNSIQKRGYLPEPYTDFILAISAEELGFLGVLVILGLLTFIILRIFLIGIRSKNTFNTLVCYGIGTFFAIEAIFNIGAVNGMLPITGVTLPFISYGGSSMVVLSVALGMVMNISANEKRHTERNLFIPMELRK